MTGTFRVARVVLLASLLVATVAARAGAAPILYSVTQVSGAEWQYSYFAEANFWSAFQGFAIDFDEQLYGPILAVSGSPDWSLLFFDPVRPQDPTVCCPAPGTFDAMALVTSPALVPFTVNFTWLGMGAPGSQAYRLYDSATGFTVFESGQTVLRQTTAVPEPGTLGVLGGALAGAVLWRRRKRPQS